MGFQVTSGTIWRGGVSFVLVSNSVFFRERVVAQVFRLLRARFGPKQFLKDLERHFLPPISWAIVLLALYVAMVILEIDDAADEVPTVFQYAFGIPLIVATIALRRVVTKASIRYFGWDETSREDYSRVLMVTESIGFVTMVLILIECYVYVPNSAMMQELVLVFFTLLELVGILAFYTTVRNSIMGFFLIFAEPFSTGSLCSIGSATGVVEQMALNTTVLRAMNGALIHIPNSVLATDYQRNYSECTFRKVHVEIHVAPTTPVALLNQLIDDLREQLPHCIVSPELFHQKESHEVRRSDSMGTRTLGNVSELSHGSGTTAALDSMAGIAELGSKCNSFRVHDLRCLQVTLAGMYCVLVTALIEGNDIKTLAKAKSKVNLAIMQCLERHGVSLSQDAELS
ncbi:hypothetical protein SPRG_00628 [Saprolegnia parasitica CBS 223.65]|uniref:Mechanosensitive ion channel MscS domain-containing protein n=1 Tax=Saprolegnia parasitica (strain CBS 223.65) TaxID=695850 RepID=A0A067CZ72_SAPPC|nr:hypothetical protein SPRG_00628 [Saprolegnia parasitica CBS 223.65]KDO34565.1 hypothetical protein SPRG_00628 [Saprolegnia parasitica CBS 223.65]|eukprot:XP_012194242.1 hypothetical protein SPRG_00628 [Saprolegnia parasitica CBS 223.65]